ncbi:hypothetical protein [Bradyrhizobium sp. CW7]|uniref:hypothetical protein n=1 Tax=Bradyrhizobium sp. CW7 TaxID=2782688 RepID=UPI001FFBCFE9|nr:hypothetical protein [Bradyrhizobium sp. CW7]
MVGRALDHVGISAGRATAIVHGLANVGSVTAHVLADRGVKIIGISDHTAACYDPAGLDVAQQQRDDTKRSLIAGFSTQNTIEPSELLLRRCDVLVPAAMEQMITGRNASQLNCAVLQGGQWSNDA